MKLFPNNQTILEAVIKTEDHISDGKKIMVSVSGGVTLTLFWICLKESVTPLDKLYTSGLILA